MLLYMVAFLYFLLISWILMLVKFVRLFSWKRKGDPNWVHQKSSVLTMLVINILMYVVVFSGGFFLSV